MRPVKSQYLFLAGVVAVLCVLVIAGLAAIASIRPIPGTPWTLLSSALFSGVDGAAPGLPGELAILLMGILLVFASVVFVLWRWQRKPYDHERFESEAALRAVDEQYRLVLDSIPDVAIQGYEADGSVVYWNAASEALYGYAASEMLGNSIAHMELADDVRDQVCQGIRTMSERGRPFRSGDLELRHRNGAPLSVYSGYAVVALPGRPRRVFCMNIDLTARKRAGDTLRIQSAALEAAANAIVITNLNGEIEWVNPAFTACTGYSAEEAIGKNPRELVYSGRHDALFYKNMWDTILGGQVWRGELINRKKDGSLYNEEQTITPLRDATGQIIRFIAIKQDVTARKAAEAAQFESEARFRGAFDHGAIGMALFSLEGKWLDVNPALCRMLGYSMEELLATTIRDIIYKDDLEASLKRLDAALAGQSGAYLIDNRYCHKSGSIVWALVAIAIVRDKAGAPVHFVAQVQDITERKNAEAALRDTQERLERAVQASNVGLWDWNLHTGQIYHSPEWKWQLGYRPDELEDSLFLWEQALHPEDRSRALDAVQAYIERPAGLLIQEFRLRHKDGSYRWILSQGTLQCDEQGLPFRLLGTHLDISERKQLEEQFLQSQKLESVGRLAGGVAHDFNNLLSVINGYAGMAAEFADGNAQLRAHLNEILRAGEKAALLTSQLLAFSRKQVLKPCVLDLNALIRESESMLKRLIGEDIDFVAIQEEELGRVKADPVQLHQVLMNLCINARDAMPHGGKLTIETRNVDLDEDYSERHVSVKPGSYVMISVTDNGQGMDRETQERLFEPFFTTKEVGKGTGLGLATVYGIVKQSNGNIWVYSEPDMGTSFKIYLPRVQAPLDSLHTPATPATSAVERGSETILVVEDNEAVLQLARTILSRLGYKILIAADGQEALRLMANSRGAVDLLITDMVMPGMNGHELAGALLEQRPQLQVLYMSGYTDGAITHQGELQEGADFIGKPFSAAALSLKVRQILDRAQVEATARN
ncbi:MAG: PAS domain S-box protein [Candidatus Hydrogenedentes bacterium]|nr:PAS domain S-box protein [Candidatus Hydrogenedentota bacterium]